MPEDPPKTLAEAMTQLGARWEATLQTMGDLPVTPPTLADRVETWLMYQYAKPGRVAQGAWQWVLNHPRLTHLLLIGVFVLLGIVAVIAHAH